MRLSLAGRVGGCRMRGLVVRFFWGGLRVGEVGGGTCVGRGWRGVVGEM